MCSCFFPALGPVVCPCPCLGPDILLRPAVPLSSRAQCLRVHTCLGSYLYPVLGPQPSICRAPCLGLDLFLRPGSPRICRCVCACCLRTSPPRAKRLVAQGLHSAWAARIASAGPQWTRARVLIQTQNCITHTHTHTHCVCDKYMHACIHYIHRYIHRYIHAYINKHTRTTHKHTHTHT